MLIFFVARLVRGRQKVVEQSAVVVGLYYWTRYQVERFKKQIPDLVAVCILAGTTYLIMVGPEYLVVPAPTIGFLTSLSMAAYHLRRHFLLHGKGT